MLEVMKALNGVLADKEFTINYLREEKARLEQALNDAEAENSILRLEVENLRGDLEFYKPSEVQNNG